LYGGEIVVVDVFEIAETLISHIKAIFPNDIAIAAYYGSYAQGTATKRSDLDFFFIPATPEGYRASIQFVVGDISFDFWPISWERAEKMASFEEPQTTIIADCRLLYVRSDDDRTRFMRLRDTISNMRSPEHRQMLTEKAELQLRDAYVHLYKMSCTDDLENLSYFRVEAHGVITKVLQSLALINRTYFTRGWGKNMEQLLRFPLKPARLEPLLDSIMNAQRAADIRSACEQLTADTLELVLEQKKTYSGVSSYPDRMKGFYEEAKGVLDKILTACEKNDYHTAFFWAISIQDEIARFIFFAESGHWPCNLDPSLSYQELYTRLGLPDLVVLLDPHNLAPLQATVERLDTLLESHLRTQGVEINRFETIKQFEVFLHSR
jgi:hypothetical protein